MEKRLTAYLVVLGFLLGNIWRVPLFFSALQVSVLDISVFFLYLVVLYRYPKKLKFSPLLLVYIFWLFLTLVWGSLRFGSVSFLFGLAYLIRYSMYLFAYLPLSILFSQSEKTSLIQALAYLFPAIGLIQYLWFPDLRPFTIYGWDMHYFRVFGTYLDPGFFGLMLFWSLLYLKNIYYWLFGFLVFAYTYSRSSFLALAGGLSVFYFQARRPVGILLAITLVAVTVFFLPRHTRSEGVRLERTASVGSRFTNWQDSQDIFTSSLLTGVGFNLLRFQYQHKPNWDTSHAASGSDSSLLFILVTSGLIGFLLYLAILIRLWQKIHLDFRLSAFFVGLLIHSFFLNSQFYTPIMLLFALSFSAITVDKTP